jgi:hypothetical protein
LECFLGSIFHTDNSDTNNENHAQLAHLLPGQVSVVPTQQKPSSTTAKHSGLVDAGAKTASSATSCEQANLWVSGSRTMMVEIAECA